MNADDAVSLTLDAARRYWLHIASGEVRMGARVLQAGDALGFVDEAGVIELQGIADRCDALLFDLPA